MAAKQIRIGIVGAGIGGLTLALALRQRGLAADVFEQASELKEIGAAVSLSANGSRELERLGCLQAIAALSAEPTEFIWREWRDDRRIAAFPVALGEAYRDRFGAPFCNIHRADLQRVLGTAHGADGLHLGHRLVALREKNNVVKLDFANGSSVVGNVHSYADTSPAKNAPLTRGPVAFAESSLRRACRHCPTRMRSSSGWGRMHTFCTTRSVHPAGTSISSLWSKGRRPGRMKIGSLRSQTTKP
jgi:hypothetical protein